MLEKKSKSSSHRVRRQHGGASACQPIVEKSCERAKQRNFTGFVRGIELCGDAGGVAPAVEEMKHYEPHMSMQAVNKLSTVKKFTTRGVSERWSTLYLPILKTHTEAGTPFGSMFGTRRYRDE